MLPMLRFRSPGLPGLALGVLLPALIAAPAAAGDIVGRVELVEKSGKMATDLSDVVVYVDGARGLAKPVKAVVAMKSKAFSPHVVAVGTGSTVEFSNQDPILHNAFSVSGEGFDLGLYKRPKSGSRTFDKPGVYTVYCNIHPQMSALVIVRDNPYFTKAAADGSFRLDGLPAGRYKVTAFHERSGEGAPLSVTVPAEGAVTAALSLDATSFKRVLHKNKYGKSYPSKAY